MSKTSLVVITFSRPDESVAYSIVYKPLASSRDDSIAASKAARHPLKY